MATAIASSFAVLPGKTARQSTLTRQVRSLAPLVRPRRAAVVVRAASEKASVVQPINGDPFIGMLETPVTSSPLVAWYLSNLPAYRTTEDPTLRGVEIGLAHGFLATGPFIKLGPLRNYPDGVAEISGCLSTAGLVLILTVCLAIYGSATFQSSAPTVGIKTLTGRVIQPDPLQSAEGWSKFTSGWLVGGLSGVAFAYILTQILPYYS